MSTLPPLAGMRMLAAPRAGIRLMLLAMAVVLLGMMATHKARLMGDSTEYLLMTVAAASHGSMDIRSGDIRQARVLMPPYMREHLDTLQQNLDDAAMPVPLPGFYRGLDGKVHAIHFPAYSIVAAVPFKLFQLAGIAPLRCYQAVNLAMVLVLGLALLRLFNSVPRALAGVALYMLCGGILYWNWSSPECLSAAALLAGFAYFCSGAPLRGGLLVGIASLQNPSIVLTLGALPVLAWCLQAGMPLVDGVKAALRPRMLAGLALGGALFAVPLLYNLHTFGVTSIIARVGTDKGLIGAGRLHSLYFDLNQGMIVAVPAVAAMLLLWGWRGMAAGERRRRVLALALVTALTVAYAVPAMMVYNWNSGAAGVMRYAFWCAMPFVFLLLWRLRCEPRWPRALLAAVMAVQAGAMEVGSTYNELQFSPVAAAVLRHTPSLYNPEPEIFAERAAGREDFNLDPAQVYAFRAGDTIMKALYRADNPDPASGLCGAGQAMAGGDMVRHGGGWIYLNGPIRCTVRVAITPERFDTGPAVMAGRGWSMLEHFAGRPAGMWSDGDTSQLQVAYAHPGAYTQLIIHGHYFEKNNRTRVIVNGKDLGWYDLQAGAPVPIPYAAETASLRIELRHEKPHTPDQRDGRRLALFLLRVALQ